MVMECAFRSGRYTVILLLPASIEEMGAMQMQEKELWIDRVRNQSRRFRWQKASAFFCASAQVDLEFVVSWSVGLCE